jgi:hypothetical protein
MATTLKHFIREPDNILPEFIHQQLRLHFGPIGLATI